MSAGSAGWWRPMARAQTPRQTAYAPTAAAAVAVDTTIAQSRVEPSPACIATCDVQLVHSASSTVPWPPSIDASTGAAFAVASIARACTGNRKTRIVITL